MSNKIMALRKRLQTETIRGIFVKSRDSNMTKAATIAGMDFVIVDFEHGSHSMADLQALVYAAGAMPVIARIKTNDQISNALDAGAAGVQIPNIDNAAAANEVVACACFSRTRGLCKYTPAAAFGTRDVAQYTSTPPIVIVQIESQTGVSNCEDILGTGIAAVFVGPYDLSRSYSVPGQVTDINVQSAIAHVATQCVTRNMCCGIYADDEKTFRNVTNMGYRYIACGVDMGIYTQACKGIAAWKP